MPQPSSSPDVSARPPPWDPLPTTRNCLQKKWQWLTTLHSEGDFAAQYCASFLAGRCLSQCWIMISLASEVHMHFTTIDNHMCCRRLPSCVSNSFKDQTSIFRSWLLGAKLAFSILFSTVSLILHPASKACFWSFNPLSASSPVLLWFLIRLWFFGWWSLFLTAAYQPPVEGASAGAIWCYVLDWISG